MFGVGSGFMFLVSFFYSPYSLFLNLELGT